MGGIIGTGLGEQSNAISGFVRESAQQQQVDMANKQAADAEKAANTQMAVSGAMAVAMIIATCVM